MRGRRRKKPEDTIALMGFLGILTLVWIIVRLLENPVVDIFILGGLAAGLGYLGMKHFRRSQSRHTLYAKVQEVTAKQIASLTRRRFQLVTQDAYGKPQIDKWIKELDYFITQHIDPSLDSSERSILKNEHWAIAAFIDTSVESAIKDRPVFQAFSDEMTPRQFEAFCADELRRAGWNARITMQSRDQGTDVIAEKGGVRIVIQCKLYARPVGNKSVQEVVAARAHERATHGAVVTNNRYTTAAEQLGV
jgi:restriction system protein